MRPRMHVTIRTIPTHSTVSWVRSPGGYVELVTATRVAEPTAAPTPPPSTPRPTDAPTPRPPLPGPQPTPPPTDGDGPSPTQSPSASPTTPAPTPSRTADEDTEPSATLGPSDAAADDAPSSRGSILATFLIVGGTMSLAGAIVLARQWIVSHPTRPH